MDPSIKHPWLLGSQFKSSNSRTAPDRKCFRGSIWSPATRGWRPVETQRSFKTGTCAQGAHNPRNAHATHTYTLTLFNHVQSVQHLKVLSCFISSPCPEKKKIQRGPTFTWFKLCFFSQAWSNWMRLVTSVTSSWASHCSKCNTISSSPWCGWSN